MTTPQKHVGSLRGGAGERTMLVVGGNDGTLNIDLLLDTGGRVILGAPAVTATGIAKAEDAAHTSGDVGVMALGVRNDSWGTTLSGTNGDYTPLAVDARGRQGVIAYDGVSAGADGLSNTNLPVFQDGTGSGRAVLPLTPTVAFNGSTWDRERNNHEVSVATSSVRTSTFTSADLTNFDGKGVVVVYDVTAVDTNGSFTITLQAKDTLSGKYTTILTGAARAATGTDYLEVYPGATVVASAAGVGSVSRPLPRVWRVVATYNSGTSQTFTIAANYIN